MGEIKEVSKGPFLVVKYITGFFLDRAGIACKRHAMRQRMIDELASWWVNPLLSRTWLSTLQTKTYISGALRISKLRKVEYKIRLQIYTFTMIKRIVIVITIILDFLADRLLTFNPIFVAY